MMIRPPLLWVLVCMLFAALMIQLAQWKRAEDTESELVRAETTHIRATHQKWRERVDAAVERQQRLETQLLWKFPDSLLPELAKITDGVSLALVGVEALQQRRRGDYRFFGQQLTFSGDYGGFSELLSVVEGIIPTIRLDGVRVYYRKRQKESLWLSLTLSLMEKADASAGALIQMPTALPSDFAGVKRSPFHFSKVLATPAPKTDGDRNPSKESPLPQLIGILWADEHPIAILRRGSRQQSVGVGEVIDGTTIISIEPQQVIVKRGLVQHHLKVWEAEKGIDVK